MNKINYAVITAIFALLILALLPLSMMPRTPYIVGEMGHTVLFFLLTMLGVQRFKFDRLSVLLFCFGVSIELTQKVMAMGRTFDFEDIFWNMSGVYLGYFIFQISNFKFSQ
jgi:glycopeptide antibiotics resistance protein